jgi:chloramphenicol 3-O-phosphotransferase
MLFPQPGIILITGIMAAGKSTIAQALAERLPTSAHLRGDAFRRMIVNGRADMQPEQAEQAWAQLRLRYSIAAAAANLYCEAGFTVVYQDVIVGAVLADVVQNLRRWPLHVIVLCPSPAVAAERDQTRHKTAYGAWTPDALDHSLRTETPRLGLWLDTSALTVEQTVEAIFAQAAHSRV